jgi:hypothetical protein
MSDKIEVCEKALQLGSISVKPEEVAVFSSTSQTLRTVRDEKHPACRQFHRIALPLCRTLMAYKLPFIVWMVPSRWVSDCMGVAGE